MVLIWCCVIVVCSEQALAESQLPTIYYLDLRDAASLPSRQRYDTRHTAACIQGLVNRDASRVFVSFHDDDLPWKDRLLESGGLCEGWAVRTVGDVYELREMFSEYINGVVLYDPEWDGGVISTSLVATTAAGVEGAIAVRKDTTAGSMYNHLVNDADGPQFPVLIDLTGKFTGSGTIWDTSTPSTGSAKCDAYIWAKEKYIDTGKCNPTVLSYTLDLWALKVYPGLREQLSNLDYAVMQKGFCFELSPWGDEAPNDDPTQPLGTDLDTFKKIINACNLQTGQNEMIKFCGFTNWDFKYTTSAGGSHDPVATEWETIRLLSAYNTYCEGDAPGRNYVSNCSFYAALKPAITGRRYTQNPPPTYNDMVSRGLIDGSGDIVPGNYILIGFGDYDQASWTLYDLADDIYYDSVRGQVYCNWGVNPNAADRVSVAMDYMYRNKTSKDYFMAWDSGAGYVNPTQLYGSRSPSGYPSGVGIWQEHCKKHYRLLDYSISGWLLNGYAGTMTTTDCENYAPFSGDGIGLGYFTTNVTEALVNNCPVRKRSSPDNPSASNIINYSSGVHFAWYRTILWSPSDLKALEDACGSNQHFLDAYTFYYLLRYHLGGSNNYRATWVADTIPRIMAADESYPVTVTVRNDGWDAWSEANLYRLGHAIVPEGNTPTSTDYDSRGRAYIPGGATISPGSSVTFSFTIAAPSTNGNYDLYYDMVDDGVTWFHEQNNIEWKKEIVVATNETDIDTDGDECPDVVEDAIGRLYWHPDDSGCTKESDFDCDGIVDLLDLAILAEHWLESRFDIK